MKIFAIRGNTMKFSQNRPETKPERIQRKRDEFYYRYIAGGIGPIGKLFHPMRLAAAEERIRCAADKENIMDHARDMVLIVDAIGNALKLSKSYMDVLGYEQSELVGKNIFSILHPDDLETAKAAFAKGLQDGKLDDLLKTRVMKKNGEYIWIETSGSVIRNSQGEITGVILINRDITEFKKSQEKLMLSEQQLREKSDKLARLLRIVIHDVKSGINSAVGFAELLMEEGAKIDPETAMKWYKIIYNSATNAVAIIDNVAVWRDSNNIIPMPANVDIFLIAEDNTANALFAAHTKGVSVANNIERGKHLVFADDNMANQIMQNLVANAVKFTPKGGKVEISAKTRDDGFVEVSVSDTGVGMSEMSVNRLFKISETFTTKGTDGEEGTGLGLTIVKELVEKSGGKVWVESTQGEGTIFTFTLPCMKAT